MITPVCRTRIFENAPNTYMITQWCKSTRFYSSLNDVLLSVPGKNSMVLFKIKTNILPRRIK